MKKLLGPFGVWTLRTCLTTFQFLPLMAGAQDATTLRADIPSSAPLWMYSELATPSLLLAPQKGFAVEMGYQRTQEGLRPVQGSGLIETIEDRGQSRLAYGITPNLFVGTQLDYVSSSTSSRLEFLGSTSANDLEASGVTDPVFTAGGRLNFARFSALGLVHYLYSNGQAESFLKPHNLTTETAKLGGSAITPELSVFSNEKSRWLFGATGSYRFQQERKTQVKDMSGFSSQRSAKGGNVATLTAFIETPQMTHNLGVALSYMATEAVTHSSSLSVRDERGYEAMEIKGYGQLKLEKWISIMPSLSYARYMNDRKGDLDLSEQSTYFGSLSARVNF